MPGRKRILGTTSSLGSLDHTPLKMRPQNSLKPTSTFIQNAIKFLCGFSPILFTLLTGQISMLKSETKLKITIHSWKDSETTYYFQERCKISGNHYSTKGRKLLKTRTLSRKSLCPTLWLCCVWWFYHPTSNCKSNLGSHKCRPGLSVRNPFRGQPLMLHKISVGQAQAGDVSF